MHLQNQPFIVSQHMRCLCPNRAGSVSQGVSTKPGRVPARNTQRGADNVSQAMYPHQHCVQPWAVYPASRQTFSSLLMSASLIKTAYGLHTGCCRSQDQHCHPPDACPKTSSQLKYSPSLSLIRHMLWFAPHLLKDKQKVKFIVLASLRSIQISIYQMSVHTSLLCVSSPFQSGFGGKLSERLQTDSFLSYVLRYHLSRSRKYSSLGK